MSDRIREPLLAYIERKHGRRPGLDEDLIARGVFDSLGYVVFVAFIENELEIDIPMSDLNPDNFRDLRRLFAYLETRVTSGV